MQRFMWSDVTSSFQNDSHAASKRQQARLPSCGRKPSDTTRAFFWRQKQHRYRRTVTTCDQHQLIKQKVLYSCFYASLLTLSVIYEPHTIYVLYCKKEDKLLYLPPPVRQSSCSKTSFKMPLILTFPILIAIYVMCCQIQSVNRQKLAANKEMKMVFGICVCNYETQFSNKVVTTSESIKVQLHVLRGGALSH